MTVSQIFYENNFFFFQKILVLKLSCPCPKYFCKEHMSRCHPPLVVGIIGCPHIFHGNFQDVFAAASSPLVFLLKDQSWNHWSINGWLFFKSMKIQGPKKAESIFFPVDTSRVTSSIKVGLEPVLMMVWGNHDYHNTADLGLRTCFLFVKRTSCFPYDEFHL